MRAQIIIAGLATVVTVFAATSVEAQRYGKGAWGDDGERLDRRISYLDERLNLNDEQVAQLREILENAHETAKAWHDQNAEATRHERRTFAQAHRSAVSESIAGILDEEQGAEFEDMRARFQDRGRRAGYGRGFKRGFRAGRFAERMDLSENQIEQIKEVRERQREAFRTELENILTPEQLEKFDEMRGGRRGPGGGPRW